MQVREYYRDRQGKARDPSQSPPPNIKHELIRNGVDEAGRPTQWKLIEKPTTKKQRASSLEPNPARTSYTASGPAAPPAAPPAPNATFGFLPPPSEPTEVVDDDDDADDDDEDDAPAAAAAEAGAATPAPAPAGLSAETTGPQPAAAAPAEPEPVRHTYAQPPLQVPAPAPAPVVVQRCGHPDCAACKYSRDVCAIHNTAIVPKPSEEAVLEHARGFLGLTIGSTAVMASAVGMFFPAFKVEVRLPTEEEAQRIAKHLAEVEWRYMPTVANHSAVTALVSCVGGMFAERGKEIIAPILERITAATMEAQQQQEAEQRAAAANEAAKAEVIAQQERPAPRPVASVPPEPTPPGQEPPAKTEVLRAAPGFRPRPPIAAE